jgi:hypothetical protein
MLILKRKALQHWFCPHAVGSYEPSLRTARRTPGGSALPAAGATQNLDEKDVFTKTLTANAYWLSPGYQLLTTLPLADLVVMAGRLHPFPFRTRP